MGANRSGSYLWQTEEFWSSTEAPAPLRITIDTNLINSKQKIEAMNNIERYYEEGLIEICATQRLVNETKNHTKRLKKAYTFIPVSEPMVVGKSAIGSFYISDGIGPKFKDLAKILFPHVKSENLSENQSNDVMHLVSHSSAGCDYFITNNKKDFIHENKSNQTRDNNSHLYKKAQALEKLGIRVKGPEQMVTILEDRIGYIH